jgi:hypothetical protein
MKYQSITWTGSRGNKIEIRAAYEATLFHDVHEHDGFVFDDGFKVIPEASIQLWVDGKLKDDGRMAFNWFRTNSIVERSTAKGYEQYWHVPGLPAFMIEEQAKKVEAFLLKVIEDGTPEDVKAHKAAEQAKKVEKEINEARKVLAAAEKTARNEDGTLMTEAQAKAWKRRYNNLHNEGGEGFVPNVITTEDVAYAESVLKKYGVE